MSENGALTEIERIAFVGLVVREAEIRRAALEPLERDYRALMAEIEKAHGLDAGAIGTTHVVNFEAMQIVEKD